MNKKAMLLDKTPAEIATARLLDNNLISYKDLDGFWCLRYASRIVELFDCRISCGYQDEIFNRIRRNVVDASIYTDDLEPISYIDLVKFNTETGVLILNLTSNRISDISSYRHGPRARRELLKVMKIIEKYAPIRYLYTGSDHRVAIPGIIQHIVFNEPLVIATHPRLFMEGVKTKYLIEKERNSKFKNWIRE